MADIVITDSLTGEQRRIAPERFGTVEWDHDHPGDARPRFQIKGANGGTELITASDPVAALVPQFMVNLPAGEAIVFLSREQGLGRLRQVLSLLHYAGWSKERMLAAAEMVWAEIPLAMPPGM